MSSEAALIDTHPHTLAEYRERLAKKHKKHNIQATVLHHTATKGFTGGDTIEAIQQYHIEHNGWGDIGANAYAAPNGKVYNARGLEYVNHCHAYIQRPWSDVPTEIRNLAQGTRQFLNAQAFGVETVGNFDQQDPTTSRAVDTALDLLAIVHDLWGLGPSRCFFHRDVAYKTCPGRRIDKEWVHGELQRRLSRLSVVHGESGEEIGCGPKLENNRVYAALRPLLESLGHRVIADLPNDQIIVE